MPKKWNICKVDLAPLLNACSRQVTKEWGVEYWVVNNEDYCTKVLELFPGYQCSLHMHPIKNETFTVLSGVISLEHGDDDFRMEPGDKEYIPAGTYHRFSSTKGALILETSTTHSDTDVVRKEDSRKM